ncbi:MAG TPA: VWA domain-containing protein [Alphaproteobacteria bacterium]|nr:VWA domain-containing protein [Alphaproteobacteria bacterium]
MVADRAGPVGAAPPGAVPDRAGTLAANIIHFARLLREAGISVGPDRARLAVAAVRALGLPARDDVYWALHATLIARHADTALFDQAFALFWRDPAFLKRAIAEMLPQVQLPASAQNEQALFRRLSEALLPRNVPQRHEDREETPQVMLSFSAQEQLRNKDFEQMSAAELRQAQRAVRDIAASLPLIRTRRFRPASGGARFDMPASLRASARAGGLFRPRFKRVRTVRPPIVLLCDISGSMSRYSLMLLTLMHGFAAAGERVHSFVFGTRLTNITRDLVGRDVDIALDEVARRVPDWDGGTRIGACLRAFNMRWSRRILSHGAVVILITDGLDRDGAENIATEIDRLHRSCSRLIWLNPLLRYAEFAPRSTGIKAILPHVDEFRPAHNIDSLSALAAAMTRPQPGFGLAKYRADLRAETGGGASPYDDSAPFWRQSVQAAQGTEHG